MPRFLDVSRAPRDLRQKRRARVFRKRARREAWDIDGGGTGANAAGAIGRTGRGTTVLTGRRSHPPPEASARDEVRHGSGGSNSEKLRARCAERQVTPVEPLVIRDPDPLRTVDHEGSQLV